MSTGWRDQDFHVLSWTTNHQGKKPGTSTEKTIGFVKMRSEQAMRPKSLRALWWWWWWGFAAGVQCTTSAFGEQPRRMLKVIHRFGKHCSCHLQGECVFATAMFAETLSNLQYSTRLIPDRWSSGLYNVQTSASVQRDCLNFSNIRLLCLWRTMWGVTVTQN
jgi:hypothetical protein